MSLYQFQAAVNFKLENYFPPDLLNRDLIGKQCYGEVPHSLRLKSSHNEQDQTGKVHYKDKLQFKSLTARKRFELKRP